MIFSCPILLGTVLLAYPMHDFQLLCLCRGTLAQLAPGQAGVGCTPATREKKPHGAAALSFLCQVWGFSHPHPSFLASMCGSQQGVKGVGSLVVPGEHQPKEELNLQICKSGQGLFELH